MKTLIHFVDGGEVAFDGDAEVKMTPLGVEVREHDGDEVVRVLFPWTRIGKVEQRGAEVAAIYSY